MDKRVNHALKGLAVAGIALGGANMLEDADVVMAAEATADQNLDQETIIETETSNELVVSVLGENISSNKVTITEDETFKSNLDSQIESAKADLEVARQDAEANGQKLEDSDYYNQANKLATLLIEEQFYNNGFTGDLYFGDWNASGYENNYVMVSYYDNNGARVDAYYDYATVTEELSLGSDDASSVIGITLLEKTAETDYLKVGTDLTWIIDENGNATFYARGEEVELSLNLEAGKSYVYKLYNENKVTAYYYLTVNEDQTISMEYCNSTAPISSSYVWTRNGFQNGNETVYVDGNKLAVIEGANPTTLETTNGDTVNFLHYVSVQENNAYQDLFIIGNQVYWANNSELHIENGKYVLYAYKADAAAENGNLTYCKIGTHGDWTSVVLNDASSPAETLNNKTLISAKFVTGTDGSDVKGAAFDKAGNKYTVVDGKVEADATSFVLSDGTTVVVEKAEIVVEETVSDETESQKTNDEVVAEDNTTAKAELENQVSQEAVKTTDATLATVALSNETRVTTNEELPLAVIAEDEVSDVNGSEEVLAQADIQDQEVAKASNEEVQSASEEEDVTENTVKQGFPWWVLAVLGGGAAGKAGYDKKKQKND